jgi:hypothetical protein
VPYSGKWHLPDKIRQDAFSFFEHKINSGFIYFRNLEIAKDVCTSWAHEFTQRPQNWIKNEYDEWALMIALMQKNYKIELLDNKWNNWELSEFTEFQNSNSIFFQSHNFFEFKK